MNLSTDGLLDFFKKETVFSISSILAIISCVFIKPSLNYLSYINWQTITLLFIIMLIVEVLKNLSVFEIAVRKLLTKFNDSRRIVLFLVFSCFFSSIFITNDVSLIIFVPFTILTLEKMGKVNLLMFTVALETIAANIGCMILPTAAPHNIVLLTTSNISFVSFFMILLPYVIVSMILLFVLTLFVSPVELIIPEMEIVEVNKDNFIKRVFFGVDYYLLLTFIALFILIGNLENIPLLNSFFRSAVVGSEVFYGIVLSQFISNVPTAMLLSSFSSNFKAIIIGINLGGLGTLIASMANLISYKILIKEFNEYKLRYLILFSLLNVLFLIVLLGVYLLTS